MPPKGWRKNADGQYPEPLKEEAPVSIDDLLFPRSTIQKLAKLMVSDNDSNMLIAKDSLLALQRAATVFVSHIMFHARQISKEQDRKGVNSQDIMGAIERAEFVGFLPEVKERLASFELGQATRRAKKKEQKEASEENSAKRQKDNAENAVHKNLEAADNEEDLDEEADDNTEEAALETEPEAGHDVDAGEAEAGGDDGEDTRNPIEILGDEERELGGGSDGEAPDKDSDANDEGNEE